MSVCIYVGKRRSRRDRGDDWVFKGMDFVLCFFGNYLSSGLEKWYSMDIEEEEEQQREFERSHSEIFERSFHAT